MGNMKKNTLIKNLLACSILTGLCGNATASSFSGLVKLNTDISDFGIVTGEIVSPSSAPFPTAPAGIPTEMQIVDSYSGYDFFNDPDQMQTLADPTKIAFLQSNPSTASFVNQIYNEWYLYPIANMYDDWYYDGVFTYGDGLGPDNFSTATKNYMTSSAFITHIQSSAFNDYFAPDSITLPSSGIDTLSNYFSIKFLGNHTINVDNKHEDPYMPGSYTNYELSNVDLNGHNAKINITEDISLGSVVDSVGTGSLAITVDGATLHLTGNSSNTISSAGFIAPANTYQGVNIDFLSSVGSVLHADPSDDSTPIVFNGALSNTANTQFYLSSEFVIRNNNPTIDFKSITASEYGSGGKLSINNTGIDQTTITSKWQDTFYDEYMKSDVALNNIQRVHAITPVVVTDASFGVYDPGSMIYPPVVHIGDDGVDSTFTFKTNSNEVYFAKPEFYTQNSTLVFNNSSASGDTEFISSAFNPFAGDLFDASMSSFYSTDSSGIVKLEAIGNKLKMREDYSYGYGIGADKYFRAKEVAFNGDSEITLEVPVYSERLTFNNSATINMQGAADLGEDSYIDVTKDTTLNLGTDVSPITLNADNPTIDLNNRHFNIASGTLSLGGKAKILADFSSSDEKFGQISVGGGANAASLDLSGLSSLDVVFTADTADERLQAKLEDASNPQSEYSLKLFDTLENGTLIDILDSNNATLTPSESNLFVTWSYDNTTHTIKSVTNWTGLAEIVKANAEELPDEVIEIVDSITNSAISSEAVNTSAVTTNTAPTTTTTDTVNTPVTAAQEAANKAGIAAARIIQTIGEQATSAAEVVEILQTLAVTQKDIDIGEEENVGILTTRILGNAAIPTASTSFTPSFAPSTTNIAPVTSPAVTNVPSADATFIPQTPGNVNVPASTTPGTSSNTPSVQTNTQSGTSQNISTEADATQLGFGVAAGDDLKSKYGVWFSPFYHKGIQRKHGLENGYKVVNHGGIFGVDCKVNEDATLGFAWAHIKSNLKQTDAKIGSKAVTNSNIFSLYGALELPHNYFITAIGSYGISSIRNSEKRPLTTRRFEFAKSKYKTKIYSTQLLGGKNIPLKKNLLLTPMAGIKYSEFHDGGYKETGTRFQNYTVSKKKTTQFDGLVGAKLAYKTHFKEYSVSPHITGMAHINIKDKPSTTYISSDAFLNTIKVRGDKRAQRAWYTVEFGLDWSKDNMEYALSYENQMDKKYVGHQAKMKVKVNL